MQPPKLLESASREEARLLEHLDARRLPRHIAVIMDGNGRWAQRRHLPRVAGHRAGVESARIVIDACARLHIPALTLYAFSMENWRRPKAEIDFLMRLLRQYLRKELAAQFITLNPVSRSPSPEQNVATAAKPPDLVVIMPVKDWVCARCGGTGDLLTMDDAGPLCMTCADLDHLVFLGAGDAALTRRAKKASVLSAVVVRWSRSRKRYERQGILVEEAALEQAEQDCLADEDARMRRRERDRERRADEDVELQARMAAEIARLFPRCPPERAEAIARHTALRGSGRVGRSAAGRALDEQAITLAVAASVRHQDTDYDSLLMSGVPRDVARDRIRPGIERILASWT